MATKTFWPLINIIKETFVTSQLWRLPCTKSAFFCQFEAFKGRIHWFSLHRQLQCSTAVKRTLPPWNLVDYSSQEIHFCGQKTGIKSASPSVRHRPRNQSSKKDYTITKRQVQRICCKGWRHWNADQTIVIWLWPKKNFEPLFNDEVARGVGILFNRGTVVCRDKCWIPTRTNDALCSENWYVK